MNNLRRYAVEFCVRVSARFGRSDACAGCAEPGQKLTLREAVTLALQNSRDLKLARVQYSVALGRGQGRSSGVSSEPLHGGGYVYTYGFPSVPGSGPPAVFQLDYTQSFSILSSRVSNARPKTGRAAKKWTSTESAMT